MKTSFRNAKGERGKKKLHYTGKSREAWVSSLERVGGSFITAGIIQNAGG